VSQNAASQETRAFRSRSVDAAQRSAIEARASRDALLRRLLALADLTAVLVSGISIAIVGGSTEQAIFWIVLAPVWILFARAAGLYHRDQRSLRHLTVDEAPALWMLAASATVVTVVLFTPLPPESITPAIAIRGLVVAAVALILLRGFARMLWRRITPPQRTLVVGGGPAAAAARRKLELFSDIHVDLVSQNDIDLQTLTADDPRLDAIDRIIVASPVIDENSLRTLIMICRSHHVRLSVVPPARGLFGTAVQLSHIADLPIIEYNTWPAAHSTLILKRILDVAAASVALVVLSPLFVIVAAAIKIDSRGGVFFRQTRSGLHGRPFTMIKFRTMVADAETQLEGLVRFDDLATPMFKIVGDPRVTSVGRFLRRTSLDEMPQLINVLRGDMSLVGPRPEQVELAERYAPDHRFRFDVKPGLTGPMQVYGRGELSFEERLTVEREYIENMSLSRDLRLLALTLPAVFGGRGAY
jgi:exopolysaccharide biosynthesis polyprenyl glycosylphosphotransferase